MNSKISFSAASKDYQAGRYVQSLTVLNQLVDVQKDTKTYALLAKNLLKLGFKSDAAKSYSLAAGCDAQGGVEYVKLAASLHLECGNDDEALLLAIRHIPRAQKDADLAYILAVIYLKRRQTELLSPFKKVLSESSHPEHNRVAALLLTNELQDETNNMLARNLYRRHSEKLAFRFLFLVFAREFNEFDEVERHRKTIDDLLAKGDMDCLSKDSPFYNLHWTGNEDYNRRAMIGTAPFSPEATIARRKMPHQWSEKIRIGYVSADFWDGHATMKLLRRVLELHDRERFEVSLFCHTRPEDLAINVADRSTWGNIVPVHDASDAVLMDKARELNIDIMVDLKGHTTGDRTKVFNLPLAPIHVAWLGFPGSTINVDIDYVIGDRHVLPETSRPFYHEKFSLLPDTYQPNDPTYRPVATPVSRAELGLPEEAFIFASFNGNRKITSQVIDSWCRILKRAPHSVIWLMANGERNERNLIKRFAANGVSAKRVIFCPRAKYEDHINRQEAADLGLDTFPVNGHTTTSEQLWGGLPVLTVKGTNFASRVSESLLRAIDLPDLVAADLQAYEDLAVKIATDPDRATAYKTHLREKRYIAPLFDAERFTIHLERAYQAMAQRAKDGLDPDHFEVEALPARVEPYLPAK